MLDDYTCFVGPNGSGKSTILTALNILFRNPVSSVDVTKLSEEDFHLRDTTSPIKITATLSDLSDEAKKDLKAYVRHGELIFSAYAAWDENLGYAEVKQVGIRNVIKDFAIYFEKDKAGSAADELRKVYNDIRNKYTDLPNVRSKPDMVDGLRNFEEQHPDLCEPMDSGDQFYGWSHGTNLLEKHCLWTYIPAVKDPTEEQDESRNTTLGKLLQRTIRSQVDFKKQIEELKQNTNKLYKKILESQKELLKELQGNIQEKLRDWSHPGAILNLIWHQDDNKSVAITEPYARAQIGEGDFIGELLRSGHGMQRSFIAALLQVLATSSDEGQPTLLLAFEEPELYQHPPQAKHLAALLQELSEGDTQVLLTTHSPYFISSKGYENIRMMCKRSNHNVTEVSHLKYDELGKVLGSALGTEPQTPSQVLAAVEQIMQPSQCELFFSKIPILVEGSEDVGFISTYLHITKRWSDFRKYGCHFVVCEGKTNMSRPLAISIGLGLHPFVIFDGDSDKVINEDTRKEHARDNGCLLTLCSAKSDPIPNKNSFQDNLVMWHTSFMEEIRKDIGEELWDKTALVCREKHGFTSVRKKNPLLIAAIIEELFSKEIKLSLLENVITNVLKHAKKVSVL